MKVSLEYVSKLTLNQVILWLNAYGYDRDFVENGTLDELHTLLEEEITKRNLWK